MMYLQGREDYGKLSIIETNTTNAWDIFYDEVKIGSYDGKTKYDYSNHPTINLQGLKQQEPLQQLYTWKSFLEDRKVLFDRDLRKGYDYNLFFNITILEYYCSEIIKYIQSYVNNINFNIEYEEIKDTLKSIPLHFNPNMKKPVYYSFEELQERIDSLIVYFKSKEEKTVSFNDDNNLLTTNISEEKSKNYIIVNNYFYHNTWQNSNTKYYIINEPNEFEISKGEKHEFNDMRIKEEILDDKEPPKENKQSTEEKSINHKIVNNDPDDPRNIWLKWNSDCLIINKLNEYEIPEGKLQEFIDKCFERNFLDEKEPKLDVFEVNWLLSNVNVIQGSRTTIMEYIRRHRKPKNSKAQ